MQYPEELRPLTLKELRILHAGIHALSSLVRTPQRKQTPQDWEHVLPLVHVYTSVKRAAVLEELRRDGVEVRGPEDETFGTSPSLWHANSASSFRFPTRDAALEWCARLGIEARGPEEKKLPADDLGWAGRDGLELIESPDRCGEGEG